MGEQLDDFSVLLKFSENELSNEFPDRACIDLNTPSSPSNRTDNIDEFGDRNHFYPDGNSNAEFEETVELLARMPPNPPIVRRSESNEQSSVCSDDKVVKSIVGRNACDEIIQKYKKRAEKSRIAPKSRDLARVSNICHKYKKWRRKQKLNSKNGSEKQNINQSTKKRPKHMSIFSSPEDSKYKGISHKNPHGIASINCCTNEKFANNKNNNRKAAKNFLEKRRVGQHLETMRKYISIKNQNMNVPKFNSKVKNFIRAINKDKAKFEKFGIPWPERELSYLSNVE